MKKEKNKIKALLGLPLSCRHPKKIAKIVCLFLTIKSLHLCSLSPSPPPLWLSGICMGIQEGTSCMALMYPYLMLECREHVVQGWVLRQLIPRAIDDEVWQWLICPLWMVKIHILVEVKQSQANFEVEVIQRLNQIV